MQQTNRHSRESGNLVFYFFNYIPQSKIANLRHFLKPNAPLVHHKAISKILIL